MFPVTQILVATIWLDDLAGIHLPIRIPDGFKFFERLDEFRPKHLDQKFAARLPVTVFAGQGASITDDQIGRFIGKREIVFNPGAILQPEINASMHQALAEMAVKRAEISILIEQRAKIAQVTPDVVR